MAKIETPKEFLTFLRDQVSEWVKQDTANTVWVEARVVEVQGLQARIHRSGFDSPDNQLYPSKSPYQPVVGDYVLCARHGSGLIIDGAINRQTTDGVHIGQFARAESPDLQGKPTAPNPPTVDEYSNQIATAQWTQDLLKSSPILGGDPKAPTPLDDDDSEAIANTTWTRKLLKNGPVIVSPLLGGNVGADATAVVDLSTAAKVIVPTPVEFGDAASKGFVESNFVEKAEAETAFPRKDTLTGGFTAPVPGVAPTASSHLVTKGFADTNYVAPSALSSYATTDSLNDKASLSSPQLTGSPTAPTQTYTDNSTKIATTAYVSNKLSNNPTIVSPQLTGTPTATSPSSLESSTRIATTAWVKGLGYVSASDANVNFSGNVSAPTGSKEIGSTRVATKQYVNNHYVPLTGGVSMSGYLTLNADPVNSMHAATRQYVLNTVSGFPTVQKGRANGITGTGGTITVFFGTSFSATPTVVLTLTNENNNFQVSTINRPILLVGSVGLSSFTYAAITDDGSTANFYVNWVAVGT